MELKANKILAHFLYYIIFAPNQFPFFLCWKMLGLCLVCLCKTPLDPLPAISTNFA